MKNNEKIPLFNEVIAILKNKCILKIDLKERGLEEGVIKVIKENNLEKTTIIASSIPAVLKKIKKLSFLVKIEIGGFGYRKK